ncbi:MAG: hypothetical protein ACRYFX_19905 [Janthinobacterium lividum]
MHIHRACAQAGYKISVKSMTQPSFCKFMLTLSEVTLFRQLQASAIQSLTKQKEVPFLRGTPVEKHSSSLIEEIGNITLSPNAEGNFAVKTTHDSLHHIVKGIQPAMTAMVTNNLTESVIESQIYDFRSISELYFKLTYSLLHLYNFGKW